MVEGANRVASITVTNTTSLVELNSFAQKLGGKEKLRGIYNNDGSITLYATTGRSSIRAMWSGKAYQRSQLGRDAISMVMRQLTRASPMDFDDSLGRLTKLFSKKSSSSMRADTLSKIIGELSTLRKGDALGLENLPGGGRKVIGVVNTIVSNISGMVERGEFNANDPLLKKNISILANELHNAVSNAEIQKEYPDLKYSNGEQLKKDVFSLLEKELGENLVDIIGKKELLSVAFGSVNQMLALMAPAKMVSAETIMMNGKSYAFETALGKSGTAFIKLFASADGDKIVVKIAHPGASKKFDLGKEFQTHLKAQGDGHPNVLNTRSIGRTPEGKIFFAMDYAKYGSSEQLATKVKEFETDGILSPKQSHIVRLTTIQDMVKGLQHVHSNKLAHLDFKPQNAFINENGVTQVADFGGSDARGKASLKNFIGKDAVYWQSPEVLFSRAKNSADSSDNLIRATYTQDGKNAIQAIFKNEEIWRMDAPDVEINETVEGKIVNELIETEAFAGKRMKTQDYDKFALGVSMLNILMGQDSIFDDKAVPDKFAIDVKQHYLQFYEKGIVPIGDHEGALMTTTGDHNLDDVINGLMNPDPEKRPSLKKVLASPLFKDPLIGSQEAHSLVAAIMDGSQEKINLAVMRMGV